MTALKKTMFVLATVAGLAVATEARADNYNFGKEPVKSHHTTYRSGYRASGVPMSTQPTITQYRSSYVAAPMTSYVPVMNSSSSHAATHVYGPESRWDFMMARRHFRGW